MIATLLVPFGSIPADGFSDSRTVAVDGVSGFGLPASAWSFLEPFVWLAAGLAVFSAAILVFRRIAQYRARERAGMQMRVLLITVPKEPSLKKGDMDRTKTAQEIQQDVGIAQFMFSAIGGLKPAHGFGAWWYGRADQFSFEMVAHQGFVSFYVAVPPRQRDYITQQIHALHPHAQIEDVEDYNIFGPKSKAYAAYLVLSKDSLYPLKTYKRFEVDPLEVLANSLAKVREGDGAVIQYIVRPALSSWRRRAAAVAVEMQKGKSVKEAIAAHAAKTSSFAMFRRIAPSTKQDGGSEKKRELSSVEQEVQKMIQEKASEAALDVNIRIVASAPTRDEARHYVEDIAQGFTQYHYYEFGNTFSKRVPRFEQLAIRDCIYRSWSDWFARVLSASEMASMFHFPLPISETPNIRWLAARKAVPPANLPQEGTMLGKVLYRGIDTPVYMKRGDRRRHVYIVGRLGVGKSETMKQMAKQDIENGEGVCTVDPHGDFVEDILGIIPQHRVDDVILFDPSDTDRPVGLNMIEATSEHE